MKKMMKLICVGVLMVFNVAQAEVIWVGDSPACDAQSKAEDSLSLALFYAIFNDDANDEIRLTSANTNYTGNAGQYTITNWNGHLTITGGYSDCGVTTSSPTNIGYGTNPVFSVNNSTVTFKNLSMRQSGSRGLVADDDSTVFLVNTAISNNQSGMEVKGGSYVEVDAASLVQYNTDATTAKGGGIYCHESNSWVIIYGKVRNNSAVKGGNLFVEAGCYAELGQKSFITNGVASDVGGGILVDNGGQLWARGGAELVTIQGNTAVNGGGLFVWGTGRVILNNTFMNNNSASGEGAAIFAANGGGSAAQVIMDRVDDCPFLISCSEIKGNNYTRGAVYAYNSVVEISRTVADLNHYIGDYYALEGLFFSDDDGKIRLNRVAIVRNESWTLMTTIGGSFEATHVTAARNYFNKPGQPVADSYVGGAVGIMKIQNSIFTDTSGMDVRGGSAFTADCNLIDNSFQWPAGSYWIGTPQFISVDTGDMRQVAGSPGVDMCLQDDFAWSTERDLENQDAPVNENTNPQGSPGQAGGLYDAGVDEVYDNIGDDMFLLTVQKTGSGSGSIVSTPLGIACGSDCTEVYFKGTLVTLYANASSGSDFIGWQGCPLVNGSGNCLTSVNSSHTIYAKFQPEDLIFANGFE